MEISRLAIVNERSVRLRRWRYGVNAFEGYVEEILQQLRLPFKSFDTLDEALAYKPDLLIAAICEENEENGRKLKLYAEEGGTVISYGGLNILARELGFYEEGLLGAGYAVLPQFSHPLRFLSAHPWSPSPNNNGSTNVVQTGLLHQEEPAGKESGPALLSIKVGRGTIERWSVNIAASVVSLQQGTGPVYDDGPEAQDGTIPTREGILKADDRCAMDWKYDRQTTETGMNYYAFPYADWWRDALIGHLVSVSVAKGKALPFLGYWPEGVPAVLAISHDSDLNVDDHAKATLQLLREIGIQTTWCMLEPGYSAPIYDQVKEDGHDLALHYNALEMDGGIWEEEAFRKQSLWLRRSAQIGRIPSNKNHYTCFEGWGELFRWCERYRIEADQTRGPSKKGNIGFLFGTCHPYFPISDFTEDNRFYDVLEIGFLSQDLNHPELYDATVAEPFLDTVQQNEGVAHFLFHQAHIHTHESVRQAVREVVNGAKKRGFALWTIAEINEWERSRRNVWIAGVDNDGHPVLEGAHLSFPTAVYIPVTDAEPSSDGTYETKFGVICQKYIVG
ncbi:hypothetical protein ACFQ3W_00970 [Paenibacillus puldeungensis]|uniref:NodB homology domain-containing protein n=1 Tax=Paenibacillus puldeungensis TaxID=696536 RepID=A0ABW3RR06_9BACL